MISRLSSCPIENPSPKHEPWEIVQHPIEKNGSDQATPSWGTPKWGQLSENQGPLVPTSRKLETCSKFIQIWIGQVLSMTKIDSFVPLDAGMFIPPLHLACDLKIGSERLLFCCIWPLLDSMLKSKLKLVVPYMVGTNGHVKCNMTSDHYIVVCCVFSACYTEIHGGFVVVYHFLGMIQAHHCTDSIS